VPVDGSEPSLRAVRHVLDLAARGLSLDVHLINVQPAVRGVAASMVSHADLDAYHRDEGLQALAAAEGLVQAAGHRPHLHVGVGSPGEVILVFAARLQCDQIVMGTSGHGAMRELLLGSVAHHVIVHGGRPVTLLH
jgi:nucleotide-binding universal stress UspA family protein